MASGWYTRAARQMMNGSLVLSSDTLKIVLLGTTNGGYVFDKSHTVVDNSATDSTNIKHNEVIATGYTRGFAGAGRKTLTQTISDDLTNDWAKAVFSSVTWTALGGATNDVINGAVILKEITNDGLSLPIAYLQISSTPTNGSDFTLTMDATNGNLRLVP